MNLSKSITEFFASLTKEPAEEAGGVIADHIRYFRVKRALVLKENCEMSSAAEQGRKDANNGRLADPKGNSEYQTAFKDQQSQNAANKK